MPNWSDTLISRIRLNAANTHIERVQLSTLQQDKVKIGTGEMTREKVISELKAKRKFSTIVSTDDGKWTLGESVNIIEVNGIEYIKTNPDNSEKDNLDNLARF